MNIFPFLHNISVIHSYEGVFHMKTQQLCKIIFIDCFLVKNQYCVSFYLDFSLKAYP